MTVCRHIPPAPGCQCGPVPCFRSPDSSSQFCPPSVERNSAASSTPAYTVSASVSEGSRCHTRLNSHGCGVPSYHWCVPARRRTQTCSPPAPTSCRRHSTAASPAQTSHRTATHKSDPDSPAIPSCDKSPTRQSAARSRPTSPASRPTSKQTRLSACPTRTRTLLIPSPFFNCFFPPPTHFTSSTNGGRNGTGSRSHHRRRTSSITPPIRLHVRHHIARSRGLLPPRRPNQELQHHRSQINPLLCKPIVNSPRVALVALCRNNPPARKRSTISSPPRRTPDARHS